MISELTPSQEAQIPEYREKWRKIAISTQRIDRASATEAVKAAYELIDKKEPAVLFCPSPYDGFKIILSQIESKAGIIKETSLGNPLGHLFLTQLYNSLSIKLNSQIEEELAKRIKELINIKLYSHPLISLRRRFDIDIRTEQRLFYPVQLDSDLGILIALELVIQLEEKLLMMPLLNNISLFFKLLREQQLQWLEPGIELFIKSNFLWANYLGIPLGKLYNQIIGSIFFWQDFKQISE